MSDRPDRPNLTDRQRQLIQFAARGLTDKEIAAELGVQSATVDAHWKRLRVEFKSSSRTQVVALALTAMYEGQLERLREEVAWREELQARLEDQAALASEKLRSKVIEVQDQGRLTAPALKEAPRVEPVDTTPHMSPICALSRAIIYRSEAAPPWRVLFVSDGIRILGYEPSEVCAGEVTMAKLLHPEDVALILDQIEEILEIGCTTFCRRYRLRDSGGAYRLFHEQCDIESGGKTFVAVALELPAAPHEASSAHFWEESRDKGALHQVEME